MNVLVVLASYGHNNDRYLERVLAEYRSMRYHVDIVVVSNIAKDLGADVEVAVGLPSKNPYSLPFAHKKILGERADLYDLFIYSEDDILITERNVDSFLEVSSVLGPGEIAGFVHAETDPDGSLYFDPPHASFHWDPSSVGKREDYTFAYFTNVHAACFILTQAQLRETIASGGFLVEPHEGKYELRETAATDPYTQCGLKKMVCISHLEQVTVRHLPANKFAIMPYRASEEFHRQIKALLTLEQTNRPRSSLFQAETKVLHRKWSKDYYEQAKTEMLSLIPKRVRNVLSIGCGWGAPEAWLIKKGMRVVGVPMDSVIAACAESKGVEMVYGGFDTARQKLREQRFDCILLSNVLHLVPDPLAVLSSFSELLSPGGIVIAVVPNFAQLTTTWRRLKGREPYKSLGHHGKTGIHVTTPRVMRRWLRQVGFTDVICSYVIPERGQSASRFSLGMVDSLLGEELICVGGGRRAIQEVASVAEKPADPVLV
jgi:SAM-dependent methyltransferase